MISKYLQLSNQLFDSPIGPAYVALDTRDCRVFLLGKDFFNGIPENLRRRLNPAYDESWKRGWLASMSRGAGEQHFKSRNRTHKSV